MDQVNHQPNYSLCRYTNVSEVSMLLEDGIMTLLLKRPTPSDISPTSNES
jgi:hypothetical protein